MMTKLIVFDFDGTLADTRAAIIASMQESLRVEGLPVASEEAIAATIGLPLEAGFRVLCPEIDEESIRRIAFNHRKIFEKNRKLYVPELFPNVKETLAALRGKGFVLTLASSRLAASLQRFLVDLGIEEYFSYVLGADSVDKAKPDPEPVLKTMRELGFSPSETIVVGDMPVDVLMGKRAGAMAVAVTYGNAGVSELEKVAPDYIIDDISALVAIACAAGGDAI